MRRDGISSFWCIRRLGLMPFLLSPRVGRSIGAERMVSVFRLVDPETLMLSSDPRWWQSKADSSSLRETSRARISKDSIRVFVQLRPRRRVRRKVQQEVGHVARVQPHHPADKLPWVLRVHGVGRVNGKEWAVGGENGWAAEIHEVEPQLRLCRRPGSSSIRFRSRCEMCRSYDCMITQEAILHTTYINKTQVLLLKREQLRSADVWHIVYYVCSEAVYVWQLRDLLSLPSINATTAHNWHYIAVYR